MTDQLGPDFDERLQAELERFRPPTPLPGGARFSQSPLRYGRLGGMKVALATAGALAVLSVVAASAASGHDPSTWPQRAVTTVESVTHVGESTPPPAPAPDKLPQTQSKPPTQTQPTKTAEPEADSPEPPRGGSPGERESHDPSPKESDDREAAPNLHSRGDHSSSQSERPSDH